MGLSKKNLGKLNTFKKNNNLFNNNNLIQNPQKLSNPKKFEEPSKIFYSIIDNSDNLNETVEANQLLKKSEDCFHNINSRKPSSSKNLSIEDELYDEFNYLLDE
ncbi:conserved hypothetical protein [Prochlorococcus marinus str. MIT 9515]|uniref:Uncharacterized protein n=1 Tax=Prochlorococcus marinus (strain MIT 9515) TaxID=167542 RepID=A2BWR3_PROM5|nr:hypothetical protein [Prochlorococcus marinus]ABM72224.1 conserved hypothetical protein [Prochlorococcus marinus str. MIT 9515]